MGSKVKTYQTTTDPWGPQADQLKTLYDSVDNWFTNGKPLWEAPSQYQQESIDYSKNLAKVLPGLAEQGQGVFNFFRDAARGQSAPLNESKRLVAEKMQGAFDKDFAPQLARDYGAGPNVNPAIEAARPRLAEDIADRQALIDFQGRQQALPGLSQITKQLPELAGLQIASGDLVQNAANTEWNFLNAQEQEPYNRLLAAIELMSGRGGSQIAGKDIGPNTSAQGIAGALQGLAAFSKLFGGGGGGEASSGDYIGGWMQDPAYYESIFGNAPNEFY